MLKYFFEFREFSEINNVIDVINKKKARLQKSDFSVSYLELHEAEPIFKSIKQHAIESANEKLANAQYVALLYLKLLCQTSSYFSALGAKTYRESWDILQDCLDSAIWIGRYTTIENRYEVPQIVELLVNYENLYPFKVFASTEMVYSESKCSICGKSVQSFDCPHIKCNLYWGEVATEIISKIEEFQAVAMVSHPLDKRCVMELTDDTRTNEEKFQMLDEFLQKCIPPLQLFSIEVQKNRSPRKDIKIVGRNEKCTCGSGKKFKNCCGQELFYEHYHHIIHLGEWVKFLRL